MGVGNPVRVSNRVKRTGGNKYLDLLRRGAMFNNNSTEALWPRPIAQHREQTSWRFAQRLVRPWKCQGV